MDLKNWEISKINFSGNIEWTVKVKMDDYFGQVIFRENYLESCADIFFEREKSGMNSL